MVFATIGMFKLMPLLRTAEVVAIDTAGVVIVTSAAVAMAGTLLRK